jgi:hypothetical protein
MADSRYRVSGSGGKAIRKRCRLRSRSDEEVQDEKEEAQDQEESTPGKTAARELGYGMKKADRDDAKTGFTAAFVERASGNVAGKITTKGGEFVVHPESEFGAMTPRIESAENKDGVPETSQKTKSWTSTQMEHTTSPRARRKVSDVVVNGDQTHDFKFFFASRRGDMDFVANLAIQKRAADGGGGGDESLLGVGFLTAD